MFKRLYLLFSCLFSKVKVKTGDKWADSLINALAPRPELHVHKGVYPVWLQLPLSRGGDRQETG